ncbi:hypothetical protein WR25_23783 isoform D [Diploscapter pachys]|uniref:Ig-like domain-containing protein n=1 Tax=Diploscapter pachys TaxID=2018661 RepID=A0A2A2JMM4_9BILA|nr:hypothetical protein WR25_23783 isoform C [Diploscapter pachys]PAV62891.1 hypothetical protein WR25_23783 isoform D [Diploscapter pachys]
MTPVGPSAPIFMKELRHQPLKPGGQLVFEARVAGIPPPTIEWFKNGKTLQNYRAQVEHDQQSGIVSLILPQMFNDDLGEYMCRASNIHGEATSSAQLLPREQYDRWFTDEQIRLTRDRKQGMLAQFQGSAGGAMLTAPGQRPSSVAHKQMAKQGQFVASDPESVDVPWGISESETEPELAALDAKGQGTKPILRQALRGLRLTEGTDAILQANVVGNPKPRIYWLYNGSPLQISGPRISATYKGTLAVLKISMITPEETGEYAVVAENRFGKVESSARIEVYPLSVPDQRLLVQQQREAEKQAAFEARQLEQQRQRLVEEQNRLRLLLEQERSERERLEKEHRQRIAEEEAWRAEQQRKQQQFLLEQAAFEAQKLQQQLRQSATERVSPVWRHQQAALDRPQQLYYSSTGPQHFDVPQQQQTVVVQRPEPEGYYQQPQSHQNRYEEHRRRQQGQLGESFEQQRSAYFQQAPQQQQRGYPYYTEPHHHPYRQQQPLSDQAYSMPAFKQVQPQQQGQKQANGSAGGHANGGIPQQQQQAGSQQQNPSGHGHEHGAALVNARPPQFLVHPQSVSVKAGETVVFNAKVAGQPVPTIEWLKADGSAIQAGGKIKIEAGADGSSRLTIEKVDAHDANTYSCVARNAGGSFQSRFSLNVLTAKSPEAPEFTGKFQSTAIYDGDSVKLYCKANGEGITFKWFKDNEEIGNGPHYKIESKGSETSLQIVDATLQEGGWYRCDASNKHGTTSLKGRVVVQSRQKFSSPAHREQITLRKVERRNDRMSTPVNQLQDLSASKSAPAFQGQMQALNLIEGQSARLEIKFTPADDPNLRIAWLQDGKALLASSRVATLSDFGIAVLEINPVTVFDQGEYTVVALNPLGEARSTTAINVMSHAGPMNQPTLGNSFGTAYQSKSPQPAPGVQLDLPTFHSDLRSQELFEGQHLHLETKLTPINDKELQVVWYLNDRELMKNDRNQQTLNHGFAVLDIDNLTKEDSGVYSCKAINKLGTAENQCTIIVHPQTELHQFEQNRFLDVDDVREMQFSHAAGDMAPKFLTQIQNFHCNEELGRSYFEARIQPINDPSLRVSWLKDGHALPNANRIQVHIGPQMVERPEEFNSLEPPRFVRSLADKIEVMQNEPVHFEARLQPANDVRMTVEWYHNGAPLPAAHRFRPMFDFGYVALDILYAYPEDSGTYTLIARNELGEAQCSLELQVGSDKVQYLDPLHPEGLERIQELEQDRRQGIPEVEDRSCDAVPKFLNDLQDITLNEHENIHCDLRLTPVNDPTMKIEWFVNGHPLITGSRVKVLYEFGFIALDIKGAIAEDSGTYSVKATNDLGEAIRQCQITVNPSTQIMSDTQHEQSLSKIEYLENLNKYGRAEIPDVGPEMAPVFVVPLQNDMGEVEEGEPVHLECQVKPVSDNTLKVTWFRNGAPIPHGHRFRTFYDFGYVSLDVLGFYAQDSGTYTCKAENALGSVETTTTVTCQPKEGILGQVQHPKSYARIQEIEAPKPKPQDVPDLPKQVPQFVKELGGAIQCMEGDNVYLEAQVTPTDDNTLTYEWLVNGAPLMKASRFVLSQDFGYIALNILYCYPEDSGTYTLIVRNAAGEAQSSVNIDCGVLGSQLTDSFHPNSLGKIADLEAPQQRAEPLPEAPKEAPQFLKPLPSGFDVVHESQTLHMEAQVSPINDNRLRYEWFHNGNPLKASSRYRILHDFGFVSLDIDYIIAEDAGTYTLRLTNDEGTVESSCTFDVERLKTIMDETAHPESLRRIREMEDLKPAAPSDEAPPLEPPVFTQQLTGPTDVLKEGQSVHMDCIVQPINDPTLRIEWFCGDRPLMFGSRIRTIHDFGYVGLEFLHVHPEDTGTYICRATNAAGTAETSFPLECKSRRNIYLDTHHESSWQKIQEMENRQEIREPSPELKFDPPQFTEQLKDVDGVPEGAGIRLECRLIPINDPTMKVVWTHNGNPLGEANRFLPARNFDLVTLDILSTNAEDSGDYVCQAVSDFGQAQTQCKLNVDPSKKLLLDPMHEASWNRVQEIESRKPMEVEDIEAEKVPPKFTVPLTQGIGEQPEGAAIHLECQYEPTNDNKLAIEWYHNDAPLANAHRFKITNEFGYSALDILYAFSQDSGDWKCVAQNEMGQAETATNFTILPRGVIYSDPQHPESWQKIQELEAPKEPLPEAMEIEYDAPQFIEPMESLERIEFQPAHFQTKVTPVADPRMEITFYKDGQPLRNSNRHKITSEFGYISLDIAHTLPDDSGVYAVKAKNDKGEAQVEATLTVTGNAGILGDTMHEQSWQRIQEMEAPRAPGEEAPEVQHGPPKWATQLQSISDVVEGQPAYFEAQFLPFSDPNTTVQWFLNGKPLGFSNRRVLRNDFGLASLAIQYVLAEDMGDYSAKVKNSEGEDTTTASLSCTTREAILGDTLHEQSWKRIQEIEAPKEPLPEPEAPVYEKPTFVVPLQSVSGVPENGVVLLEAKLTPINDPSLRVEWFFNDSPLGESNWIAISNDFGCVSLRIAPAYARHSGTYTCRATNANGTATTSASVEVQGSEGLLLDTAHPVSLQKIQELEALDKYARLEAPEHEYGPPQWVQGFESYDNVGEGEVVTLHGLVEPSGDPNLRIEWQLNGQPLTNANRFRQEHDFGNVIMTIVHVLPHDTGVYTCRAYNLQGEALTSSTVKVAGYERILLDPQHPVSWQRIQELEAPKVVEVVEEEVPKEKPYFLTQLESVDEAQEGAPIHLEGTFQPARDSELKAVWQKNGAPLGASQLVQTRHELGWATLDILSANEDHNGVYTLTISNSEGEAVSTCQVKVAGTGPILGDTRHEESWKQIQILEAPKEPAPEAPAPVYDHPAITTQIQDQEVNEGEHSHFEAVIVPVNDPSLQVQWIRNGQPLSHGSKYAIQQDFGICMLDVAYTFPEDSGVIQLRIWNSDGEAVSSATLKCHPKAAILGDTQHEESWKRIQEIEAVKPQLEEAEPEPKGPPRFTAQLTSPGEVQENQPAHFEATIEPVDDPNLTITWYLNGAPIASSSRVKMINDFGWIIMDINQTEVRDSGDWKCVAKNAAGEAESSASLNVVGKETLLLDTMHPQSLDRIRQIEAGRGVPMEQPEAEAEPPKITVPLTVQGALEEGGSAHLQAQYTPNNARVEWLKDGHPIAHSNRHKMLHDFGFAVLDIIHLLKNDAGQYTLRVWNDKGDATTDTSFTVEESSGLHLQPQSESAAKAVEALEQFRNRRPDEVAEEVKESIPVFIEPLSAPIECDEGGRAHFTARYEPINDNNLRIQFFHDGRPLKTGSRVKTINEFGYVVLEISPVYPEDNGEYTCRAINNLGEAVTSTRITCNPKENIISKTQLPERMAGAGAKIAQIEAPKPGREDAPDAEHGPPKFTTQLVSPPELLEGEPVHLEAQLTPVNDPRLKIEWFHDGNPVGHSNRMRMLSDFGLVVLEILPGEPQDTGTWTCKATNDLGSDEVSAEVKVVGQSGIVTEWQAPGERKERIEELEEWINRPKDQLDLPTLDFEAPHFSQQLTDLGTLNEADATAFVCVLEPIGDPTMRVEWLHNGHPIPYSNRISTSNEFGVATLLIKHLIAQDAGEYVCRATNAKGEATTTGKVEVDSPIQIEGPQIVQPLVESIDGTLEGDSIHLECRITPINDPNLKIQWLRDGQPLPEASRFRPVFEFGFVSLDILYAYPEDNGSYELVAYNDKGEARTKSHIVVLPRPSLDYTPQTHGANQQDTLESHFKQHSIQELMLTVEDAYDESKAQPPVFKVPLTNIGVSEGDFCRFETQIAPINDPYMKVEWFCNKKPVLIGHRFRSTLDFGFTCLDLLYALPDDTGEYHCVATNKHGQAMISGKLACQGASHIITDSGMPQGMNVRAVKQANDKLYWTEQQAGQPPQPKQKQKPQFTIPVRNIQVTESDPARFECAVIGYPRPKVTWFINGNQALHGHRYKLNFDGLHYLTVGQCRISDAGEVVAIARNSEGETISTASLDVFQRKDFRQQQLRPAVFKTPEELAARQQQWQKETLGKLGEAFEAAPKPDSMKLMVVERAKSPIEPLETEELLQKFTKPRDDQFYEQLSYVETQKPQFEGMKLEDVALKAGKIEKYVPPREEMEKVDLKNIPDKERKDIEWERPDWAQEGGQKLPGAAEDKFKKLPSPERELDIPARDQIKLKIAKPKRATEVDEGEHVKIAEDKAKLKQVQQGPEVPPEEVVIHKDQVQLKQQPAPKIGDKIGEHFTLESKDLKQATVNVKPLIEETTFSNKYENRHGVVYQTYRETSTASEYRSSNYLDVEEPLEDVQRVEYYQNSPRRRERVVGYHIIRTSPQPRDIGQSKQAPPTLSQQLQPIQAELGKPAKFTIAFSGAAPIKVTWFKDGKELKSTFRHHITTTESSSALSIARVENNHAGEYMVKLENVAGVVESLANLAVTQPTDKGKAPDFSARLNDLRVQQNAPAEFVCKISGEPKPVIQWFKDGQPLPNDDRIVASDSGDEFKLTFSDTLPTDVGIYEIVAKNLAGEARCKARLNLNLQQTGKGTEAGPKYEAPRFSVQIEPIVVDEGKPAQFTAKYSGFPEPAIRWYQNNAPVKKSSGYEVCFQGTFLRRGFFQMKQQNGEAILKIESVRQEDVAEYKVEASNPAGKASSVANLVLTRKKLQNFSRNSSKFIFSESRQNRQVHDHPWLVGCC